MQKKHSVVAGLAATATLGLATLAWSQQPQGPAAGGTIAPVSETPDAPSGTAGRIAKFNTATTLTNSVIREQSGRIGIGLTPNGPFGGSLQIATAPNGNGLIQTNGTVTFGTFAGNFFGGQSGGFGVASSHPLHFTINGASRMQINPDGNIGIGNIPGTFDRLIVRWDASGNRSAITGINTSTGYAGYFAGKVTINGTLTKPGGSFKIDHPADPANKYLSHSFVESPDMKNIYDGGVVLDAKGRATVTLPAWFGALNRDFQYQLTAIGAPGPNLYIAEEIADNRFVIAGGKAAGKVSWQVTGIRQDAWANAHRIPTEETKPVHERGLYLTPRVHGQPDEKGIDWARLQGRSGAVTDQAAAPSVADRRLAAVRE